MKKTSKPLYKRYALLEKALTKALRTAEAERDMYKEALAREMAESENYKKRLQKGVEENIFSNKRNIILAVLPVVDDMDNFLRWSKDEEDVRAVRMIMSKLEKALTKCGVEKKEVFPGTPFDPSYQTALFVVPVEEDVQPYVATVVYHCYYLDDILIRPAGVSVGKKEK